MTRKLSPALQFIQFAISVSHCGFSSSQWKKTLNSSHCTKSEASTAGVWKVWREAFFKLLLRSTSVWTVIAITLHPPAKVGENPRMRGTAQHRCAPHWGQSCSAGLTSQILLLPSSCWHCVRMDQYLHPPADRNPCSTFPSLDPIQWLKESGG